MIIEKSSMTKEELKQAAKKNLQEVNLLKIGNKVKHKGKTGYIAIVEKIFKNGRVDLKVIEENGNPTKWFMSHKGNVTKWTDTIYTFNECFEIVE